MTCQRCGLCCMNCGDLSGDAQTDFGPCSGLTFENGLAVCLIEENSGKEFKPDVCNAYPFPDIDGGKCQRELNLELETRYLVKRRCAMNC